MVLGSVPVLPVRPAPLYPMVPGTPVQVSFAVISPAFDHSCENVAACAALSAPAFSTAPDPSAASAATSPNARGLWIHANHVFSTTPPRTRVKVIRLR